MLGTAANPVAMRGCAFMQAFDGSSGLRVSAAAGFAQVVLPPGIFAAHVPVDRFSFPASRLNAAAESSALRAGIAVLFILVQRMTIDAEGSWPSLENGPLCARTLEFASE